MEYGPKIKQDEYMYAQIFLKENVIFATEFLIKTTFYGPFPGQPR